MERINTQKVKQLLEQKNLTQKEFCTAIGITTTNLSKAFSGERYIPYHYLLPIAKFFGVDPFSLSIRNSTNKTHTTTTIQRRDSGNT